jgi:hypothetical protein
LDVIFEVSAPRLIIRNSKWTVILVLLSMSIIGFCLHLPF